MEEIIFRPSEGKFSKVRCIKCKNEQVIFTRASTEVRCLVCNEILAKPTGGKVKILAEVIENYS
ncbi:MAG: 30S ribosomal protein S27e [Candidatus Parvarchaeota archaeon]|jgi:SSU ribosomal protein S27E|nr:30S ribosomal protein S27e [Candidatus Parvarchaeota archaeon]